MRLYSISKILSVLVILSMLLTVFSPASHSAAMIPAISRNYFPNFAFNFAGTHATFTFFNPNPNASAVALDFTSSTNHAYYDFMIDSLGTRVLNESDMPAVLPGIYNMVLSSSQPFQGLVTLYRHNGNSLSTYPGEWRGADTMVFGPIFKTSAAGIENISQSEINQLTPKLYNAQGDLINLPVSNIPVLGSTIYLMQNLAQVPNDFSGMLVVSTPQQYLAGLLQQRDVQPNGQMKVSEMRLALIPQPLFYLPRVLKGVDEDGGLRTSQIFVGNPGTAEAAVTLSFISAAGEVKHTLTVNLAANQSTIIDLDQLSDFEEGQSWAVKAESLVGFVLSDLTRYRVPSSTTSSTFYNLSGAPGQLALPRLVKMGGGHSVYSIVNSGSQSAETQTVFYDAQGHQVASLDDTIPASGWVRHDMNNIAGLPEVYIGTAIMKAKSGSNLSSTWALVDEYYRPCVPPDTVNISRIPADIVHDGETLRLTANPTGTGPLDYTWQIDGQTKSFAGGTLETKLSQGNHTIAVSVRNQCGQASTSQGLPVEPPQVIGANLSTSTLTASQPSVLMGESITYDLVIRNTGGVSGLVTLNAPLPTGTEFQGPAQASDGQPVVLSLNGTSLTWSGTVEPGSPVVINYTLKITDGAGTLLHNDATLQNGSEQALVENNVNVGKDYGLVIAAGALATNQSQANLDLSWNTGDNIVYYRLSNEPGFGENSGTTEWLPISNSSAGQAAHTGWDLQVGGETRLPRTVYVRYRGADGVEYGPYADDILYDAVAPASPVVIPTHGPLLQDTGSSLSVKTSDDNSGVGKIQISPVADFSSGVTSYTCMGRVTNIPNPALPGEMFYLRVIDRSGNVSPTVSSDGTLPFSLFLPAIRH